MDCVRSVRALCRQGRTMSKRRREPLNRDTPPTPIQARTLLAWTCQACRLTLHTKENAPTCPRCSATLLPPPDAPRTFRADCCDECGKRLAPGYRLAGMCEDCLTATARREAKTEKQREPGAPSDPPCA